MRQVTMILILLVGHAFAESCLDLLVRGSSFMGVLIVPDQNYYLDSTYSFSETENYEITRKYFWTDTWLDSIQDGGSYTWRFYKSDSLLPANSNDHVVLKTTKNDTLFVRVLYYRDGMLSDTYVTEKHWQNGVQFSVGESQDDTLMIQTSRLEKVNDTIRFLSIHENQNVMTAYVVADSKNSCVTYDSLGNKQEEYTLTDYSWGFEFQLMNGPEQRTSKWFYRYFQGSLAIRKENRQTMTLPNMFGNYNLIGQRIQK